MKIQYLLTFLLTMLLFFSCTLACKGIQERNEPETGNIKSLDVYKSASTIHLLLAKHNPQTKTTVLHYQRSDDRVRSWSSPVRVDAGSAKPYARGRGTDFHIAAHNNSVVAVWMTKGSGFMGRGPLVTAYSEDGGKNWIPGPNPADDGTDGDHAFIDVTADPTGFFHLVWLDKRSGKAKGLYSSTSKDGGKTWSKNQVIDPEACDCCWNVVTSDNQGKLYTLYRDLNPRDMALATSNDQGQHWNREGTVGDFDWDFDGCPHVGGGIAINNDSKFPQIHTMIWTGKEENSGLYYMRSQKNKSGWTVPRRMGSRTAKVPDIVINEKGHLAAVWDDFVQNDTAIFIATSTDNGDHWTDPRRISIPGFDATHARLVSIGEDFYAFWTETKDKQTTWNHSSF